MRGDVQFGLSSGRQPCIVYHAAQQSAGNGCRAGGPCAGRALTVCAYSGGLQGTAERDAVLSWARALCPQAYRVAVRLFEHEAGCPPVAVCIEKKCASRPPHSS